MMLSLLLLIPFLGAFGLLLWPSNPPPGRMRAIAITTLAVQLLWTLRVLLAFDPQQGGMQLQGESGDRDRPHPAGGRVTR